MAKFENPWRDITPRVMGPWSPFCHYTFFTLETKFGISFSEVGPQTEITENLQRNATPRVMYPLAPIPIYTIHPVIVHIYTNFQISSFHSSWEICYENFQEWQNLKTYEGTELQRVMGPWPTFCHYTSLTFETKCGISFIEVGPQT